MGKPRLAIDMDQVIADMLGKRIRCYNDEFGEALSKDQLQGKNIYRGIPEGRRQWMRDLVDGDGFFADLEVIEDSQSVIRRLAESYDVFIATAAMEVPASLADKYRWLREHFAFLAPSNFVFCGDKSIVCTDYLIDDQPGQLERFSGKGLLFSAPHNAFETRFERVNGWADVERRLRSP